MADGGSPRTRDASVPSATAHDKSVAAPYDSQPLLFQYFATVHSAFTPCFQLIFFPSWFFRG